MELLRFHFGSLSAYGVACPVCRSPQLHRITRTTSQGVWILLGIERFSLECAGRFDALALILRFGSTRIQNRFEFRQHRLNSTWNYRKGL